MLAVNYFLQLPSYPANVSQVFPGCYIFVKSVTIADFSRGRRAHLNRNFSDGVQPFHKLPMLRWHRLHERILKALSVTATRTLFYLEKNGLDANCKCSFHASLSERCVGGGRNVLLDVSIARRNVRLWLVIIVVRNEVFDRIRGKVRLHFAVELSCKSLVVG